MFPAPLPTQDHLHHRATESGSRVRTHLRTHETNDYSGHNAALKKQRHLELGRRRPDRLSHGSGGGPFAQPHGQRWQKVPTVAKGVQELASTSPFAAVRASADGRYRERMSEVNGALALPPSPTSSYAMPCSAARVTHARSGA